MASDTYLIPDLKKGEIHRTEFTVKKSRFITSTARTHGVDEAKAFIDKITKEFSDARHNCFAFNADRPGSSAYVGCWRSMLCGYKILWWHSVRYRWSC